MSRLALALLMMCLAFGPSPSSAQDRGTAGRDATGVDQRVRQFDQDETDKHAPTPLPGPLSPNPEAAPGSSTVILAAVVIDGAKTLEPAELAPLYEEYLARQVTIEDMASIAEKITQHFRDQGYFLTRAFVPPQALDIGILRVRVLEGSIVESLVTGTDHRRALVESHLARIREETPVTLSTMERSLLLIGDIPGLVVKDARLEEVERATGRFRLVVELDRDFGHAFSSIDNRGDPDAGRSEIWASGSLLGIGSIVDRLQAGVFTIPEAPDELKYGEVTAARLLGSYGLELEGRLTASMSEPGPDGTETVGTESESQRATVTLSVPLYRHRDASYWGRLQLDARAVQDTQTGVPIVTDHLRVGRAAIQGSTSALGGQTWSRFEVSFGTTNFGGSTEGDDRSRGDADSSFTKFNFELSHVRAITETIGIYGYLSGQVSDDALLSAEEFAVGGLPVGRGYEYSEISGEHGLAGTVELRYGRQITTDLLSAYQFYGFYDAGAVWNKGTFEDSRDTLASTGFGVRLTTNNQVTLELEAARPLTRATNGDGSRPWLGFVTLSASF